MDIKTILEKVKRGELGIAVAEKILADNRLVELADSVKFDLHRDRRSGIPEVVFAEGKTPGTCKDIAINILKEKEAVLFTRLGKEHAEVLSELVSSDPSISGNVNPDWRIATLKQPGHVPEIHGGKVGIITAGTSDIPVAKEAEAILNLTGCNAVTAYDVGISGLHRLIEPLRRCLIENVDVIIVIAGMEGALPSVVAGLVDIPVIGVPVSTGYGFGSGGIAALSTMLQSCSPGLAVVNIDSGFAAGAFAALVSRRSSQIRNNPDNHS